MEEIAIDWTETTEKGMIVMYSVNGANLLSANCGPFTQMPNLATKFENAKQKMIKWRGKNKKRKKSSKKYLNINRHREHVTR